MSAWQVRSSPPHRGHTPPGIPAASAAPRNGMDAATR